MTRLFVAVASGQNVANLPPILELGSPGDEVVWIESPRAREAGWVEAARPVLERAGLQILGPSIDVDVLNDPHGLARSCAEWVCRRGAQNQSEVVLVLNGGTKLCPIGLWKGFTADGAGRRVAAAYGGDRPVELWWYPDGLESPPEVRRYERHDLDLQDIVEASGYSFGGSRAPLRLWPLPILPPAIQEERYGADSRSSADLHDEHLAWAQAGSSRGSALPTHAVASRVLEMRRLGGWKKAVRAQVRGRNWSAVFNGTRNVIRDAQAAVSRQGVPRPSRPIGPALERAVARRVHAWLDRTRHAAVLSAWTGVELRRRDRPDQALAELDVVLVLRNGILVHLECKAAMKESIRDFRARLQSLQDAASRLAMLVVCAPLFTEFQETPWFERLHRLRDDLDRERGVHFLPFTLPGQPGSYRVPGDQAGAADRAGCPPFEEGLDALLRPFG